MLETGGLYGEQVLLAAAAAAEHQLHQGEQYVAQHRLKPGLAIKTHPKKPTLKNPLKCFFCVVFLGFLNFFFIKMIQTFLFETDFL